MTRTFTPGDEGKQVVTPDGDVIGSIVRVQTGDAHVRPKPGLLEGCGSWLTGSWEDFDAFRLDGEQVDTITDETVIIEASESDASRSETTVRK